MMAGGLPELQLLNLPAIDQAIQQRKLGEMRGELLDMQLASERRRIADAEGLQSLWQSAGGDSTRAIDAMMQDPRYYSQAVKMRGDLMDIDKKRADTRKVNVDADDKSLQVIAQNLSPLLGKDDLTHRDIISGLSHLKAGGYNVDPFFSQIPGDPAKLKPWLTGLMGVGVSPDKTLERYTPDVQGVNLGGTYRFADKNPLTNPEIVGQTFQVTRSPDSLASEATQRYLHNTPSATAVLNSQQGKIPPGYRVSADGTRLEAIPGGPSDIGKALPGPAVKELGGAGAAVENTQRLQNTFKDDFGGKVILGDMSNTLGRIFGDDTGQAQWWQDMEQQQNQTRHELFGSALTKTELAAWEKTAVTPNMDANQIRQNLARRSEIESRAASKVARAYQSAGYNKDQIRELLGTASQYLETPAPPAGTGRGTPTGVQTPASTGAPVAMKTMPNPAQYRGYTVTDQSSGVRYQSNGSNWVRIKE